MVNLMDPSRARAAALKITARIPDAAVRERLTRIFTDQYCADKRCSCVPTPAQLRKAEPWVAVKRAAGEEVRAFRLSSRQRASSKALVTLVCDVIEPFEIEDPSERAFAAHRHAFMSKIGRMSLADIESTVAVLSLARVVINEARSFRRLIYHPETIAAANGRRWTIVQCVADLKEIGLALNNCLKASSPYFGGYAREMLGGASAFWALRDGAKIVAAARVRNNVVTEFRAQANAAPTPYLRDFAALLSAKAYTGTADYCGMRFTIDGRAAAWFAEAA